MSNFSMYKCGNCSRYFDSSKGLSLHWYHHSECRESHIPLSIQDPTCCINSSFNKRQKTKQTNDSNIQDNPYHDYIYDQRTVYDNEDENIDCFVYSNNSRVEVSLLKIINEIGAPHYAYKLLMDWAQDAYVTGYKFASLCSTYSQQIKKIEKWLSLSNCKPFQNQVILEPDNLSLKVTCFPFVLMLQSILSDPELNQESNLVVPLNGTHFCKYKPPDGLLGEVNTGYWYRLAYKNMVKNPESDFLCPIIFSMDKTTLSNMGSLHVYAIMFTTTLFNAKVSND